MSRGLVLNIVTAWIGALLALITFQFLTGEKNKGKGAIAKFFGATEKYGTWSPVDLARVNDPEDAAYEFPLQRNDARRPARKNNRTRRVVYPQSGAPSMLPSAPMSSTAAPNGEGAQAFDQRGWGESPGAAAFDGALLSDLLPSQTAAPVRSMQDLYGQQLSGRASRVPIDS